jgi:hypothetical protein
MENKNKKETILDLDKITKVWYNISMMRGSRQASLKSSKAEKGIETSLKNNPIR